MVAPAWRKFEKWVSTQLWKIGLTSKVSCQSRGGLGAPDVAAYPFHVECKCYQKGKPNISKALAQAQKDTVKCDLYPVAITQDSTGEVIVSMSFANWKNFVIEYVVDHIENE